MAELVIGCLNRSKINIIETNFLRYPGNRTGGRIASTAAKSEQLNLWLIVLAVTAIALLTATHYHLPIPVHSSHEWPNRRASAGARIMVDIREPIEMNRFAFGSFE